MIWHIRMTAPHKGVHELRASTLIDAFKHTMEWTKHVNDGGTFWFRGVNNCSFELVPGAYWRSSYSEIQPLIDLVQEGRAFADIGEIDDWRTYYFAQHNGIPTRLLDWTESFLAALFFAMDGWDGVTTPCIWVIRPECVNELAMGWPGLITPEQNKELNLWLPEQIKDGARTVKTRDKKWTYDSRFPLAIYPRKGNARIIAQQGVFTIHGTEKIKLNDWIVSKAAEPEKMICRVLLDGWKKEESMNQLQALGIRRHTMYPDLSNYIQYLKESYGW
jgi:hypothetical protein